MSGFNQFIYIYMYIYKCQYDFYIIFCIQKKINIIQNVFSKFIIYIVCIYFKLIKSKKISFSG